MHSLRSIITSPSFLALPVTALILPFLPDLFDRYEAELLETERFIEKGQKRFCFYSDLDGDGISETVHAWITDAFKALEVRDHKGGVMNHINLPPQHQFTGDPLLSFADLNEDGKKEIRCITHKEDSIFLTTVMPFSDTLRYLRFVDTVMFPVKGEYKPKLGQLLHHDLNGNGRKEVIFSMTTAFSVQPRNVYAYDQRSDSIRKSPKSGAHLRRFQLFDLNKDGKDEILLERTAAYANVPMKMEMPYRDTSAWLMAFDSELQFLFEPVEFPNFKSFLKATPYRTEDGTYIAALYQYKGSKDKDHQLILFDENGQEVEKRHLESEEKSNSRQVFSSGNGRRLFMRDIEGMIHELDMHLRSIRKERIGKGEPVFLNRMDIDDDGKEELLFKANDNEELIITRSDLSYPVTLKVPAEKPNLNKPDRALDLRYTGSGKPQLFVQNNAQGYLFDYRSNPSYYLKYPVFGGVYVIVFIFIYGIQKAATYKLERDKKKLEKTVEERTQELQLKNAELEEKNKAINDSIDYAQKIQNALLQSDDHVSEHLPDHFVLFKPQSQVSGDFYWAKEKNGHLYVAAIDCTGHGVPGAFMSMLGISLLNEIMNNNESPTPGEVLDQLRERVIRELSGRNSGQQMKDGMDGALVKIPIPKAKSQIPTGEVGSMQEAVGSEMVEVQFAGAQNPLYVIRKGIAEEGAFPKFETFDRRSDGTPKNVKDRVRPFKTTPDGIEIKGDPHPIGYSDLAEKSFSSFTLQLHKGDMLYIFSDGYADQFGGPKGKKFQYRSFKKLLAEQHQKPAQEQKKELERTFEEWKGQADQEQIDDVVVIGVRV